MDSVRHHAGRALVFGETPQARLLGPQTYRLPGLTPRVDRRTLRSILIDRYGGRCAISGEPVLVTLEAAHAWPRMFGGPDELGNLFLLSVEFNRLWDAGLIGVDGQHRILVSDLLRLSRQKSRYLGYAGQPLNRRKFGRPYPDEASLRWHREHLFRWPKYKPKA